MHQHPETRACPFHRTQLGEPFQIPETCLVEDASPKRQLARLARMVASCEHGGYRLENHSLDVMTLSVRLARYLGFDRHQLRTIKAGSYLHDIGKIFTCLSVLLSNKQGLPDAEWDEVMRHPAEGAQLVTHPELAAIRQMIGCHHEWCGNPGPDRGGLPYPEGLSAERVAAISVGGHGVQTPAGERFGYPARLGRADLPEEVLLLSVADWYAGSAERRLYRPAQPHEVAMRWTEEAAALGKIDPQFTLALGRMLAERPWVPCTSSVEPAAAVAP